MPKTSYTAHAKKNGRKVATLHFTHDNLPAAKKDAAALAGMIPGAKGLVEVKNPARRAKRNPARDYAEAGADAPVFRKAAEVSIRSKMRAKAKPGDQASIIRWLKENDRGGEYDWLKWDSYEAALDQLRGALGFPEKGYDSLHTNGRRNPANPPREVVLGHVVIHSKSGYTIPAYKRTFSAMKDVRKWLKEHVKRETSATPNPRCRCKK